MKLYAECGCGRIYKTMRRTKNGRCPNCIARAIELRAERRQMKNKSLRIEVETIQQNLDLYVPYGLTVIKDPLEVGAFAPGTYFPRADCRLMIAGMSFTDGTLFRDARGKKFEYKNGKVAPYANN